MRNVIAWVSILIISLLSMMPVTALAAESKAAQPVMPYEKIVAKSGSWYYEQVSGDKGSNLIVGYTGVYRAAKAVSKLNFEIKEKMVLKGICLPFVHKSSAPVSIKLTDEKGKVYGNFPTSVILMNGQSGSKTNDFVNYIFSSEGGIILPEGKYTMTLSSFGGYTGDFIVKGMSCAAYEAYMQSLIKWEADNKTKKEYDFTGTYSINLNAYKTNTLMGKVTDRDSDFSLKDFELTILRKNGELELIGKYEGMPFSQACKIVKVTENSIDGEFSFTADLSNLPNKAKIGTNVSVKLFKPQGLNAKISVKGSGTYVRIATSQKGGDINTYDIEANGVMRRKELPVFVMTALGKQGGAGNIPGPDNAGQAAAGILFPPLVGVAVNVIEELLKSKSRVVRDKSWYKSRNPNLTDAQIANLMLADAMGSTDNPDEGDAVSIGDNEKPGGEDYISPAQDEPDSYESGDYEQDSGEDNTFGKPDAPEDTPDSGRLEVDGTYITTGSSGETVTQFQDGTIEISTPDGETVTRSPDGITRLKYADGTVHEMKPEPAVQDIQSADKPKIGGAGDEPDNSADLLRAADTIANIYSLAGIKNSTENLAKVMKNGLADSIDNMRDAFKSGNRDEAIKMFRKMNFLSNNAETLKQIASGLDKGFEFAGMGIDILNNMQDINREDGSLLRGDGAIKATVKSIIVNKVVAALVEKNPAVVLAEILVSTTVGGTEAGDLMSPITNIKGALNAGIDAVLDPQNAVDRALAGGYGKSIKSIADTSMLGKEALDDPTKFIKELGEVGNDKSFYQGMYDTAGSMFRDENGNIGKVGAVGEATVQMGVAMAETAAGMAKMTGDIAGRLYEGASQKLQGFFNW